MRENLQNAGLVPGVSDDLQADRQAIVVQPDGRRGRGQTADVAQKRETTSEVQRFGIDETVARFAARGSRLADFRIANS